MWAHSRYYSICIFFTPFLTWASYSISDSHTTETTHGLWEIKEAAETFQKIEEKKNHIYREVLDPNLKIIVPRCITNLRAEWNAINQVQGDKYTISVFCDRTIESKSNRKWKVLVPTKYKKP